MRVVHKLSLLVATMLLVSGCGPMLDVKSPKSASVTPPPSSAPVRLAPQPDYTPEYCGVSDMTNTGKPSNVLLTIDDFPGGHGKAKGQKLLQVADWARSQGVMMEAFPIKAKIDAYDKEFHTDLLAELRARGTYVSNHSHTHQELTKASEERVNTEIKLGVESTYLRPPYGAFNPVVKKIGEELGYRLCTWTLDTKDWRLQNGAHPSAAELVRRVHDLLVKVKPGTPVVILGHYFTNYPSALQGILDEVVRMGMRPCAAPPPPASSVVPFPVC